MCFADVVETTDTIYIEAETNGIAESICKAIDIGKMFMVPLFAIMFCIYGFRAFQGDGVKWSTFVTFALGMAAFNHAGTFLEWFMPKMGLDYGCFCAVERDIRDTNGVVKTYPTGLNYDCTSGMTDYYSLHGLDNGGILAKITEKKAELSKLENIVASYEALYQKVVDLSDRISQQQAKRDKIMNDSNNTQALLNAYNNVDAISRYNSLLSQQMAKKNELDNANNRLSIVNNSVANAKSNINDMQKQIDAQTKAVKIAEDNYNEAKERLEKYQTQTSLNQNSLDIFAQTAENALNFLNQEKQKLNNLKINLNTYKESTQTLINNQKTAQEDVERIKQEYNSISKEVSNCNSKEVQSYLNAKESLKTQSESYTSILKELNTLTTNYQVQKKKLDDTTAAYQDAKTRIPSLKIEIAELSSGKT